MENKKRGPVTIPGKKVSSKNAIKHGATAKGFINDKERDRYEELISDLTDHYESSNPLIGLQLERIARVTIQLERIQNTIDANTLTSTRNVRAWGKRKLGKTSTRFN